MLSTLYEDLSRFMILSCWMFLDVGTFHIKIVQTVKKPHVSCQTHFLFKKWDNYYKYGRVLPICMPGN